MGVELGETPIDLDDDCSGGRAADGSVATIVGVNWRFGYSGLCFAVPQTRIRQSVTI
jgi:hypothetical protein